MSASPEILPTAISHASAVNGLVDWLRAQSRVVVLTGAGCSTASGIPDYRDGEGAWKRKPPVQHRDFMGSHAVRQRYWARSLVGWRHFAGARPNPAHHALAALEAGGRISHLITQNVDGLHQQAGSRAVIDLHGRLDSIECQACGGLRPRAAFQAELESRNPAWRALIAGMAPDGDADLECYDFSRFDVPSCDCGGVLKPAVVFFGDAIPAARSQAALVEVRAAEALLVVGSSLMVWSGYRLVREAAERGVPVAALNLGRTRADELIGLRLQAPCAEALEAAVAELVA